MQCNYQLIFVYIGVTCLCFVYARFIVYLRLFIDVLTAVPLSPSYALRKSQCQFVLLVPYFTTVRFPLALLLTCYPEEHMFKL
jgi:hypothetical protein